jgi:hypothetical protein
MSVYPRAGAGASRVRTFTSDIYARYSTAQLHAEIDKRYRAKKHPRSSPRLINRLRISELERFYRDRYGGVLPDDDAGRDDLEIAAHHIAIRGGDVWRNILAWARRWAPWMSGEEAVALAERIEAKPRKFSADELAQRLGLTDAKRTMLGIRTIGAIDVSAKDRAKRRKKGRRQRDRVKRAERGAISRRQYLAQSLSATRPWESEGISRRTWERRRRKVSQVRGQ